MSQRSEWKRYAIEAMVIVASILFALWVDATWEEYQDRQHEQEYMAGLAQEFELARRELATDQRVRKAVLDNLEAALRLEDPEQRQEARRMASSPSNILNKRYYTPSHTNLEDLLSSGNLQLLRSDELRKALLNYSQERDRVAVVEAEYREYIDDNMEPWLIEHAAMEHLPLGLGPDQPRPMDLSLWDDPRFVNRVWLAWGRLSGVVLFGDLLAGRISDVQQALRTQGFEPPQ